MRKKAIHAGILACVFVVAIIIFSYAVNRNHVDMTADIGNASLPQVSLPMILIHSTRLPDIRMRWKWRPCGIRSHRSWTAKSACR